MRAINVNVDKRKDDIMTAKTKTERTIETLTCGLSQSIYHRELYELGNLKIKLELNTENFEDQCYANAYVLDGLKWSLIYTIPYPEMKTPRDIFYKMAYRDGKGYKAVKEFENDVQRLKKYVKEILG